MQEALAEARVVEDGAPDGFQAALSARIDPIVIA